MTVTNVLDDSIALRVGGGGNDVGRAVTVDGAGNTIVAGLFRLTADVDPGAGTTTLTSNGGDDIFVAKYSPTGSLLWARAFGGPTDDEVTGLALGPSGSVTITGTHTGAMDVAPGQTGGELTNAGGRDIWVATFSAAGTVGTATSFGTTGNDDANAVAVDGTGNIYLTGSFSLPLFGLNSGTNAPDAFVVKLTSAATLIWAANLDTSTGSGHGHALAVGSDGHVFVGGQFSGTIDLDPGAGTLVRTADGFDGFFAELDGAGAQVRAFAYAGPGDQIVVDLEPVSGGDVIIGGRTNGEVNLDPVSGSIFVIGNASFIARYQPSNAVTSFWGSGAALEALDVDSAGNVAATGSFTGVVDFRIGGIFDITANNVDAFVLKLNGRSELRLGWGHRRERRRPGRGRGPRDRWSGDGGRLGVRGQRLRSRPRRLLPARPGRRRRLRGPPRLQRPAALSAPTGRSRSCRSAPAPAPGPALRCRPAGASTGSIDAARQAG